MKFFHTALSLLCTLLLLTVGGTKEQTETPSEVTSASFVLPFDKFETPAAPQNPQTRNGRFKGAWFSVVIPRGFTVLPGQPSESGPGVESARFRSPDGSVEFYVFAPQWTGVARDIALDPRTEREISRTVRGKDEGKKVIAWTIAAKDGSYQRSYQEIREHDGMSIIGLRYANKAAYDRHRPAYLAFKKSLQQYAD